MRIHTLYRILSKGFRRRRLADFVANFQIDERTRILDVGGMSTTWTQLPVVPDVTLVNRAPPGRSRNPAGLPYVIADGTCLPFENQSFDVVFSNSVIEHLATWDNQQAMAAEIARVGISYYVQTPNKHFPIEPHWLAPGFQYLPRRYQRRLGRWITGRGIIHRPSQQRIDALAAEIRLLDVSAIHSLFPDAQVTRECFAGLTKSLIAARNRW